MDREIDIDPLGYAEISCGQGFTQIHQCNYTVLGISHIDLEVQGSKTLPDVDYILLNLDGMFATLYRANHKMLKQDF